MKPHSSERPFTRIDVAPFWKITPPWEPKAAEGVPLIVNPGAGFGSGSHETTALCLQALAFFAPRGDSVGRAEGWRLLDFGSGSAVLSIAAAKLGAEVNAVEIDADSLRNGLENAALNGLSHRIHASTGLPDSSTRFDVIVANILRPVLLEFAAELTTRLAPQGILILSGLVASDVSQFSIRYSGLLGGRQPESYQKGEWRALVWR